MNEYLKWDNETLIETGKRLNTLIGLAKKEMKEVKTAIEMLDYSGAIIKAEYVLEQLRIEYKKRQ